MYMYIHVHLINCGCSNAENHTRPIIWYNHTEGGMGSSVIQGPMYRGCLNPSMYGWLVYGDYMTG